MSKLTSLQEFAELELRLFDAIIPLAENPNPGISPQARIYTSTETVSVMRAIRKRALKRFSDNGPAGLVAVLRAASLMKDYLESLVELLKAYPDQQEKMDIFMFAAAFTPEEVQADILEAINRKK